ncbi:hypothetical protein DVH24_023036 [Malus domestica]|uniref:Serine/threonine specific protein phosphatases domain-containing protein n=1 Tax=Malus domestica TaxID=3750 RepID=A0A498KT67_MALDO|nr:hypothetical protein DVH24_023036 [Malus domestica]
MGRLSTKFPFEEAYCTGEKGDLEHQFENQAVEDGFQFFADGQLVTVYSAPNYRGVFDNVAAMMTVDENLMRSFQILKPAEKKSQVLDVNKNVMTTVPALQS